MTDQDIEKYVAERLGWRIVTLSKEYQHYGIVFKDTVGRTAEPHEVDAFNFAVSAETARRGFEKVIKGAIQILGRPVLSYAPKLAIEEYDKKIQEATLELTKIIRHD